MAAANVKWIPPLPPGWEGRWDPNQKAYFFINHTVKKTTWEDPRYPVKSPAHSPSGAVGGVTRGSTQHTTQHHTLAAGGVSGGTTQHHALAAGGVSGGTTQHHALAAQSLSNHGSGIAPGFEAVALKTKYKQYGATTKLGSELDDDSDEDLESVTSEEMGFGFLQLQNNSSVKVDLVKYQQLKEMYPTASNEQVRNALIKNRNNLDMASMQLSVLGHKKHEQSAVHHPAPHEKDMLERLTKMYPAANAGIIKDILATCHSNEKNARAHLESIGYKPDFRQNQQTQASSQGASPSKQMQPTIHHTRTPSPKREPSLPKLSDREKENVTQKLKATFPDNEKSVIEMALEACQYNENKARELLTKWESSSKSKSSIKNQKRESSPAKERTTTTSPVRSFSPASLEPLFYDERPSTSSSRREDHSVTSQAERTTGGKKLSTSSSPSRPSSSQTGTSTIMNRENDTVVKTRQQKAKQVTHTKPMPTQTVVKQPTSTYKSQYRTVAKGPNPSLLVGPNKDNLISGKTVAKGPNKELQKGPDSSLVKGPQGALGPNRSNRCGPQSDLHKGPSIENLLISAS